MKYKTESTILNASAVGKEIHTPSTPNHCGRINSGIMRKTSVLNSERIAEVFPSFNAVKNPDANKLKPISINAAEKIYVPRTDIRTTFSEPSANR